MRGHRQISMLLVYHGFYEKTGQKKVVFCPKKVVKGSEKGHEKVAFCPKKVISTTTIYPQVI